MFTKVFFVDASKKTQRKRFAERKKKNLFIVIPNAYTKWSVGLRNEKASGEL